MLFLAAALGCSKFPGMETKTDTPANNSAAAPASSDTKTPWTAASAFVPSGDAKADIEKMADRFLSQRSFTARMEGTGTIPVKADLEFLAPDRFRLTHYRDGGQLGQMIVIGQTTYMNAGGKWQKMQIGMSVPNMRETFTREGMKWFKDTKYEGEESLEGKTAHHYSYDGEMPGTKKTYSSDIWINAADGLPIKIEAVYHSGDLKTMHIGYDYSKEISIEAPID